VWLALQYSPQDLVVHKTIVVTNLELASMSGVRSEGMLLVAVGASGDIANAVLVE
jgi:tRNA-binding EMAP/Myf-like protein